MNITKAIKTGACIALLANTVLSQGIIDPQVLETDAQWKPSEHKWPMAYKIGDTIVGEDDSKLDKIVRQNAQMAELLELKNIFGDFTFRSSDCGFWRSIRELTEKAYSAKPKLWTTQTVEDTSTLKSCVMSKEGKLYDCFINKGDNIHLYHLMSKEDKPTGSLAIITRKKPNGVDSFVCGYLDEIHPDKKEIEYLTTKREVFFVDGRAARQQEGFSYVGIVAQKYNSEKIWHEWNIGRPHLMAKVQDDIIKYDKNFIDKVRQGYKEILDYVVEKAMN